MTARHENDLYGAADLDPILDELSGITGLATMEWEDLDEIPEVPLPEGLVDRAIEELMRGDGPRSSRRWPRLLSLAALIPVFLSISFVLVLPWMGRNVELLSYEEAHSVTFDPSYKEESRNTAALSIARLIGFGVDILRHRMHADPALQKDGEATLQAIQNLLDNPGLARDLRLHQDGWFFKVVERLETADSKTEMRQAMEHYVAGSKSGFAILHHARAMGGLIGEQVGMKLDWIKRHITIPIAKLKKPRSLREMRRLRMKSFARRNR